MQQMDFTRPITLTGCFRTNVADYLCAKGATIRHGLALQGGQLVAGHIMADGRAITESALYRLASHKGIPIFRESDVYAGAGSTLLVDKYKPTALSQVIGHAEQIKILRNWLETWGTQEKKAVLISGPPGIGKTTVAHLIAAECGWNVLEFNASDVRSESAVSNILEKGMGAGLVRRQLVVMDEVDGMSGSDRGGIGALSRYIRSGPSRPIICITNEKTSPKMRPLLSTCLDVQFSRPTKTVIAKALAAIAQKEGIGCTAAQIQVMCEQGGNDIRAILNLMQFNGRGGAFSTDGRAGASAASAKNVTLNMFSAAQKLFSYEGRTASIDGAVELVSADYMMIPLMVAEGYVGAAQGSLDAVATAADRISFGDMLSERIMKYQSWSLLSDYMVNTVSASRAVRGQLGFNIFPQWLGKHSKEVKHRRQLGYIGGRRGHGRVDTLRMDVLPSLCSMARCKTDAKEFVDMLIAAKLTRDDFFDVVVDTALEPVEIPTKLKTAITREYKKRGLHQVGAWAGAEAAEATEATEVADDSDDDDAMLLDA